MDVVLVYELSDPNVNDRVEVELNQLGYRKSWRAGTPESNKSYNLPKYMVWKKDITFKQALEDINTAINRLNTATANLNLTLKNCITLSSFPWDGIPATV